MPVTFPIKVKKQDGTLTLWFDRLCLHLDGEHELIRVRSIDVLHRDGDKLTLHVGKDKYSMTMLEPDTTWDAVKECSFPAE